MASISSSKDGLLLSDFGVFTDRAAELPLNNEAARRATLPTIPTAD
jgi:hypothetical protein